MDSLDLAKRIAQIIDSKLGEDIQCIDLKDRSTLTDYMIIATGKADTHVKAISDALLGELKKEDVSPYAHEGFGSGSWVCIDYGDAIVHIMRPFERSFYNLAAIWGGAEKLDLLPKA
ncbi:MAG: ribosome silencing factor [Deferribacteraceae bacterium]|jgi:ribosome-associated protein|nr:ribosome silencing factor [Deferribacteraceae bacterium]